MEAGQGSFAPSLSPAWGDGRVASLIYRWFSSGLTAQPGQPAADPLRNLSQFSQFSGKPVMLTFGVVLHAVPHLNWYKVNLGQDGFVGCCWAGCGSTMPLGVRVAPAIPPYSAVIVWHPPGTGFGLILGVLPAPGVTNATYLPD